MSLCKSAIQGINYPRLTTLEIFGVKCGEKVWYAINKCVRELFEEYRVILTTPEPTTPANTQVTIDGGGASMMKKQIASRLRQNNSGQSASSKSELEKYLAEDSEDPEKKIDILGWWKENSSRFPILANMARDILAIPITTVASESAFRTSGRILDDFRTSLTPFMVYALVCTQDWLRRSTDPVDIKENWEELEVLEKELIEEFGDKVKGKRKVNGGVVSSSMAKSNKCASRPTM